MDQLSSLRRIEIPSLEAEKAAFKQSIIGQEEAIDGFAHLLVKLRSGIRSFEPGPLDSKFLAGPSGVGKTETVLAFADLLSGNGHGRDKVIVLNGGEFQDGAAITRLFGSPPGYVGSAGTSNEVKPILSQSNLDKNEISFTDVNGRPQKVTIVLVDEADKADIALHQAFLSVLDKGKMQMADNSDVDFSRVIVFYTSNTGNHRAEKLKDGGEGDPDKLRTVVADSFKKLYPPELRGRMNEFIIFRDLREDEVALIATKGIEKIVETFSKNQVRIALDLSSDALSLIVGKGFSTSEGVRAMKKVIRADIYNELISIHGAVPGGLNGKRIYIDIEDEHLTFYFNVEEPIVNLGPTEGLPDSSPIDPEIITKMEAALSQDKGILKFHKLLTSLKDAGIIKEEDKTLSKLGRLKEIGIDMIVASIKELSDPAHPYPDDPIEVLRTVNSLVSLGVLNDNNIISIPEILELCKQRLLIFLQRGVPNFNEQRDKFVENGLGSKKFWNDEFEEQLLEKAKS